jgi:hypothetical protein
MADSKFSPSRAKALAGLPQFAPAAGDFMLQVETWMLARIDQA